MKELYQSILTNTLYFSDIENTAKKSPIKNCVFKNEENFSH
jgi:hypothetical protein